ncbi:MAG: hypothetical protein ISS01_02795 [Nanoarchaeota archaeon]|nr:hypothetical protein [Nanoarchaeota archaeon]
MRKKQTKKKMFFEHISEYPSFEDFEKDFIHFLTKVSLEDLYEDSYNFFCHNDYSGTPNEKTQHKAINKILKKYYPGKNISWFFIPHRDDDELNLWGPHIEINRFCYMIHEKSKKTLDQYIKLKMKELEKALNYKPSPEALKLLQTIKKLLKNKKTITTIELKEHCKYDGRTLRKLLTQLKKSGEIFDPKLDIYGNRSNQIALI